MAYFCIGVLLCAISFTLTYAQPAEYGVCSGTGIKYKYIDDYRRSINYDTSGNAICDSLLETGWYRFTSLAGGLMPTTCVGAPYKCGTFNPISFQPDGPMPKENETTSGDAIQFYSGTCSKLRNVLITAMNCSSYLIYNLQPTPGCTMAYCAGDRTPCVAGEGSHDGFTPCSQLLDITVTNQLREDKVFNADIYENRYMMQFHCDVTLQGPDLGASTMVEVSFQANGVLIQTTTVTPSGQPGQYRGILDELGPWKMGDSITCNARAVNGTRYTEWSTVSNSVSTGIVVEQTFIEVSMPVDHNAVYAEIKFHLISPIYCDHNISYCSIRVYFNNPSDAYALRPECRNPASFSPMPIFRDNCYVEVSNTTQHLTQSIQLTAMVDDYISSSADHTSRNYTTNGLVDKTYEHDLWSYYRLAPVTVKVNRPKLNEDYFCYQTPDPHFTSYIKRYFDYHGEGEFVIFKHKIYAIQVNLLFEYYSTHSTYGNITSVCGAAVRVDRRVITFNHCDGRLALEVDYRSNNCSNSTSGMRLVVNGTQYEVHIATGAKFVLQPTSAGSKWYYTWYYPSKLDYFTNTGGCGIVGAKFGEDLIRRDGRNTSCPQGPYNAAGYSQSCINSVWDEWKATPEEELMNGQAGDYNCTSGLVRSCMCIMPESEAENKTTSATCQAVPVGDVCNTLSADQKHIYEVTTKSSSYATHKSKAKKQNVNSAAPKQRKTHSSTEAYDRCYEAMIVNNPSADVAKQLMPIEDIMATVNFCAFDLEATGDDEFLAVHTQALAIASSQNMYRNASIWTPSPETGEMVPPEHIATQLCPNSCSGHGTCSNMAVCVCDVNYAGADCSIDLTQVPADMHLMSGDVCDILTGACDSADVYGEWFVEGSSCKYRSVAVDNTTVEDDSIYTVPNYYLSISTVRCPLPRYALSAYGFNISVSNAGSVFSEELFLLVYNSDCRNCDITRTPPCTTLDFCEPDKNKMKHNSD